MFLFCFFCFWGEIWPMHVLDRFGEIHPDCVLISSMSYSGVLRRSGSGCDQYHRSGVRPAIPALFAVSIQQTLIHAWQVSPHRHLQDSEPEAASTSHLSSLQGYEYGRAPVDRGRGGVRRSSLLQQHSREDASTWRIHWC